jgi:hypothetical protein
MAVILINCLISFDKFVRMEYETDRDAWIADGKPGGIFWSVPEESTISTAIAGQMLSIKIIFRTPQWVKRNPNALRCLKRLRISAMVWYASVACSVLVAFFSL